MRGEAVVIDAYDDAPDVGDSMGMVVSHKAVVGRWVGG